jgi:hypothetical protein
MRTIGVERVTAIISDSGSPMVKAQELLTLKYSHIIGIRCSAHVLNLLIQDLCKLPTMYNLITNAKINSIETEFDLNEVIVLEDPYTDEQLNTYDEPVRPQGSPVLS